MKLSTDKTTIDRRKLEGYLLNLEHEEGRSKAVYLAEIGYTTKNWEKLENDLREQILSQEAKLSKQTVFGMKYEIVAPLNGPNGKIHWVKTIWIIRDDEKFPRFVTLIPEKSR